MGEVGQRESGAMGPRLAEARSDVIGSGRSGWVGSGCDRVAGVWLRGIAKFTQLSSDSTRGR